MKGLPLVSTKTLTALSALRYHLSLSLSLSLSLHFSDLLSVCCTSVSVGRLWRRLCICLSACLTQSVNHGLCSTLPSFPFIDHGYGYGYGSASRDYPLIRRSFTFSYSCTAPAAPFSTVPSLHVYHHVPSLAIHPTLIFLC